MPHETSPIIIRPARSDSFTITREDLIIKLGSQFLERFRLSRSQTYFETFESIRNFRHIEVICGTHSAKHKDSRAIDCSSA